jgi:hypothetical protein
MKTITETDDNFTVVYDIENVSVDFKVYEIIANDDKPYYEGIGGCGADDKMTQDIEKANIYLTGKVKWDGCSHYYFGDEGYMHLCGDNSIIELSKIIKKVYCRCYELGTFNKDKFTFNICGDSC